MKGCKVHVLHYSDDFVNNVIANIVVSSLQQCLLDRLRDIHKKCAQKIHLNIIEKKILNKRFSHFIMPRQTEIPSKKII